MNGYQNEQNMTLGTEESTTINFNQQNDNEANKKMKPCSTCGNLIAKKAKRCPYCGAKNKKKFYKRVSFWILIVFILLFIIGMIPKNTNSNNISNFETTEKVLHYKDVYEGGEINTDFVSITIDEVSTTDTIYSINSNAVLNADPGEIYVYVKGTITNTSYSSYDIGGMGSWSYDTSTYLDADLELSNGTSEYGSLLIDNGGMYGILSDGYLSSNDEVTYYIAFRINESDYYTYNKGEITLAFTENFEVAPSYDRSNCEYLYRINY